MQSSLIQSTPPPATGQNIPMAARRTAPESDTALTTVVAALATSGSISGLVWDDEDIDGWQGAIGYESADDTLIENVKVSLYACKDLSTGELVQDTGNMKDCADYGAWILEIAEQYTAADGSYSFTNLAPGYYIVKVDESTIVGSGGQTR